MDVDVSEAVVVVFWIFVVETEFEFETGGGDVGYYPGCVPFWVDTII